MSASISLTAGSHLINGALVTTPATRVALIDSTTGYSGDGTFTISVTSTGTLIVTAGTPPNETATQINLGQATVVNGNTFVRDRRNRQVPITAVNSTVMPIANGDGSYLSSGVVTLRTLDAALQDEIHKRAVRCVFAAGEFTPTSTGADVLEWQVPQDPDNIGGTPTVWNLVTVFFRVAAASSSGAVTANIERSTATTAFVNVGNLLASDVSITATDFEATSTPTLGTVQVNGGDKLKPTYTGLGTGASGFSFYAVLEET
jgi:hypothetical protein